MIPIEKLRAVRTIVTHANCPDGTASAMVLRAVLPNARVLFMQYGTAELAALAPEPGMLFCDFSPPAERAAVFRNVGAIVLDHHKTARAVVESFGGLGVYADNRTGDGNRITRAGSVITTGDQTAYAVHVGKSIIVYRDRAQLPYTRLATFVREACESYATGAEKKPFRMRLVPRLSKGSLIDLIKLFSSISSISTTYRHSQSPGQPIVDRIMQKLRAKKAREGFEAAAGKSLDKNELIHGDTPIAKVVQHIDVNSKNGDANISGKLAGENRKLSTTNAIQRSVVKADSTDVGIAQVMAAVARMTD